MKIKVIICAFLIFTCLVISASCGGNDAKGDAETTVAASENTEQGSETTEQDKIEKEILEKQKELIEAKTQNLQSAQRIEELYANALDAMRNYGGRGEPDDY